MTFSHQKHPARWVGNHDRRPRSHPRLSSRNACEAHPKSSPEA
jgi:hypothetical protein